MEGDVCIVEQAFTIPSLGDRARTAQVDAFDRFQTGQINQRQRIIEAVGDNRVLAIGSDDDAARTVLGWNVFDDELGRQSQMTWKNIGPLFVTRLSQGRDQLFKVDHSHSVRAGTRHIRAIPLGRDCHIRRVGEAQVRFIEQHLVNASVFPDDSQSVGDGPALHQSRHGNQGVGAIERT